MRARLAIDCKVLWEAYPEAARLGELEYLKRNSRTQSDAARVYGITRPVVYDVLEEQAEGDLTERSKALRD